MIIAVTGLVGSGKTTFCDYLAKKGAGVVDADVLGKEVLSEPIVEQQLITAFGKEILKDGKISSELLAPIAFSNIHSVTMLNSISHPHLRQRIAEEVEKTSRTHKVVLIDVALFAELASGLADITVLLQSDKEWKKEKLLKRRDFQTPLVGADFTIINNGPLKYLYKKADEIWEKIK